ncbi:MAG: methionyl-tRNA formyltransferase [Oscillospiraceae bacterium]
MRIVFMGTPDFALPSLARLCADGHCVAGVFTQPDKPQGRHFTLTPSPVKTFALEKGLLVFQPPTLKNEDVQQTLRALAPELIIVTAYGKLLPPAVLVIPTRGCVNVHGSLLPRYRGAAPIQRAIINQESVTGVTIMNMAAGLDTGDILLRRETPIGPDETAGALFDRLSLLGADALSEALASFDSLLPQPQNEALATWAAPLNKQDGALNVAESSAAVYARLRGVSPCPGAWALLPDGKRLKIHRAIQCERSGVPGTLCDGKDLIVACGEGALALLEVQPEGGRRISGSEFLNGKRLQIGDCLFQPLT